MTMQELEARLATLKNEIIAKQAKAEDTDEYRTALDALLTDAEDVKAKLAEARKADAAEKRQQRLDAIAKGESIGEQRKAAPQMEHSDKTVADIHFPMRGRPNGGFESRDAAYTAGMWCAGLLGNQRARKWVEQNGVGDWQLRTLNAGSGAAGGYLVPDELESAIIWNRDQVGVVAQYAQRVTMGSDTVTIPASLTECTIYEVGQAPTADVTATSPTFGGVQVVSREWMGMLLRSNSLSDDSVIDLAGYIAQKLGYAHAQKQDDTVFIGDGTATYGNYSGLTVAGVIGAASIVTMTADDFGAVTAAELADCEASVASWATDDLAWYCSSYGYAKTMRRLENAAGGNTNITVAGGPPMFMYDGYPVRIVKNMNSSTASDITSGPLFLFGSLRQTVVLGTRKGMTLLVDPYTAAAQNMTRIISHERWGIAIHDVGTASVKGGMSVANTPA
jgi:HK97 family phage major capsid protein